MDLHVYRNSQDRWHDLRSAARERGAILAVNAVTLDELVERLTPDVKTASAGQRLVVIERALHETSPAVIEGVNELEWSRIPLLGQEGWPRHQTLEGRGRGGHSGRTTPSALSKVASQHFLDAQPPLLSQEGITLRCDDK